MALGEGPVERVGEGVLAQVGEQLLVDLEGGEVGGVGDGLLGEGGDDGGLVAGGVDELVVDNLDVGVVGLEAEDLVGDGLGVGEGGDVLTDAGEGQDDVLGVGAAQLGAGLLADQDQVGRGLVGGEDGAAHEAGQAGVDTTAEALVGAADDVEGLLALGLEGLRLGVLEDLAVGLAVLPGGLHGALGAGQLGGGDDLHGVGDLLDVLDGLETVIDLAQGGVGGGIGVGGGGGPIIMLRASLDLSFLFFFFGLSFPFRGLFNASPPPLPVNGYHEKRPSPLNSPQSVRDITGRTRSCQLTPGRRAFFFNRKRHDNYRESKQTDADAWRISGKPKRTEQE